MAMLLCMYNYSKEHSMNRTTVMLPGDLKLKAKRTAENMGISLGELIRLSLKMQIGTQKDIKHDDTFLSDTEVFNGPVPDDFSLNHDKYLYGDNE